MIADPKVPPCLPQSAGESLAEAAQNSEGAKLAARDLAKALGRPEFLRHKDKVCGMVADSLQPCFGSSARGHNCAGARQCARRLKRCCNHAACRRCNCTQRLAFATF